MNILRLFEMTFNGIHKCNNYGFRSLCVEAFSRLSQYYNYDSNENPATNGEYFLLKQFLKPEMVIFDVGSNFGNWTAEALKIQPNLTIFAFEPEPKLFKKLQNRWKNNPRVTVINAALSDSDGTGSLKVFNDNAGSNSLFSHPLKAKVSREETVTLICGDTFAKENSLEKIDLIKIDTEGAEFIVLKGFSELFSKKAIAACQIEYGSCYIVAKTYLKDIFDLMQPLHYHIGKITSKSVKEIKEYHWNLETFKYSNYLITAEPPLKEQKIWKDNICSLYKAMT